MRRFFVPRDILEEEEVRLPGEVLHHIAQVLRLEPGEEILLLDGEGAVCRCRLLCLERGAGRVRILERRNEREQSLPIRMLQGIPKGDKMDLILQKGTELGVAAFDPVIAHRSISRPGEDRARKRLQRWERIVLEAARQSCRTRLPAISPPRPLAEAARACREELRLLLWEEESRPLRSVLPDSPPRNAAILVGPEGGITAEEAETARQCGFVPVRVGPRILRTETAGFTLAAILQYLYGDLAGDGKSPGRNTPAGGQ